MKLETHWHFMVAAYQEKGPNPPGMPGFTMSEVVQVEVLDADTEEEAVQKARDKIRRNHYFVQRAWQCAHCINDLNQQELNLLNIKTMIKMMKGG